MPIACNVQRQCMDNNNTTTTFCTVFWNSEVRDVCNRIQKTMMPGWWNKRSTPYIVVAKYSHQIGAETKTLTLSYNIPQARRSQFAFSYVIARVLLSE